MDVAYQSVDRDSKRRLNVRLAAAPAAVSKAREALATICGDLDDAQLDDVRLLVSELVTNSVRHSGAKAGAPVLLDVELRPDRVRIEVTDAGHGFDPVPRDATDEQGSGWGLFLVERLADRWGVVRGHGTRVWFEIDRSSTSSRA